MTTQRPEKSHTGAPTIDVGESMRLAMFQDLNIRGALMFSSDGQSVWALTDECQKRGVAYEVQIAKDANKEIQGVVVINLDANPDISKPEGWTVETVETWSNDNPAISKHSNSGLNP